MPLPLTLSNTSLHFARSIPTLLLIPLLSLTLTATSVTHRPPNSFTKLSMSRFHPKIKPSCPSPPNGAATALEASTPRVVFLSRMIGSAEANLDLYLGTPPNTPHLRQHQSRHHIRCGRGSEQPPLVISAGEAATAHVAGLFNIEFVKVTLAISFEIPSKMHFLGRAKGCHCYRSEGGRVLHRLTGRLPVRPRLQTHTHREQSLGNSGRRNLRAGEPVSLTGEECPPLLRTVSSQRDIQPKRSRIP